MIKNRTIAIAGRAGSGKDLCCKIIRQLIEGLRPIEIMDNLEAYTEPKCYKKTKLLRLADPIRTIIKETDSNIDDSYFEDRTKKEKIRPEMIRIGDLMKKAFGDDIFARQAIANKSKTKINIVPDLRLPEEQKVAMGRYDIIIKILSLDESKIDHRTENSIDELASTAEVIIDHKSLGTLVEQLCFILQFNGEIMKRDELYNLEHAQMMKYYNWAKRRHGPIPYDLVTPIATGYGCCAPVLLAKLKGLSNNDNKLMDAIEKEIDYRLNWIKEH